MLLDPEKNFRLLLENTPDIIMHLDWEGRILFINHTLPEYNVEEVLGKPVFNYLSAEDGLKYKKTLQEVFHSGKVDDFEVSAAGPTRWYVRLIPVLTNEEVESVLVIATDVTDLMQKEKALVDSEIKFRTIMEAVPTGISITTPEGRIIDVNETTNKILGYDSKTELLKQQAPLYYRNPDVRKRFIDLMQTNNHVRNFEAEIKREDGTFCWLSINSVRLLTVDEGSLFISTFQDITDRKKTEDLLLESEARYKRLADASFEGIIIHEQGKLLEVNKTAGRIFGYEPSEMIGKDATDFTSPRYREMVLQKIKSGFEGTYEAAGLKKDGTEFPIEIMGKNIHYDGRMVRLTAIRDITERKEAESQHKELELKYQALFDSAGDSIFIMKGERLIDCNKKTLEILGCSREEFIGKTPSYFSTETQPDGRHSVEKALELINAAYSGKPQSFDWRCRRLDGSTVIVDATLKRVDVGKESVLIGVMRDISERKRREEESMRTQKLESLGILAGGIAHDFNNLLTGIIGSLSLVEDKIDSRGDAINRLKEAEKAALRAKELTRQLLTFSKGGVPVKRTISLDSLIDESSCFALRGSNVRCERILPEDLWLIDADESQLVQVINNLVINSDQAMPDGGRLRIAAENYSVTGEENLPLEKGRFVRIMIEDEGIGIPDKIKSRIFDPYFTTKQKGSGLGLATVYSIIKKHGGHIEVASKVGVGTTFQIYLPASDQQAVVKKKTAPVLPASASGRVLIMDDEEIIRKVASSILTGTGYDVTTASEGNEAIQLYKEAKEAGKAFDAVVMDLTIPGGMGGKDAIGHLLKYDSDARVIVTSGYSGDPIIADYKQYGFKCVLEKPYKAADLKMIVHQVITGKD